MEGWRGPWEELRGLGEELAARLPHLPRPAIDAALAHFEAALIGRAAYPLHESDGQFITDGRGIILEANAAAAAALQTRAHFLVGKPFTFFLAEGHWQAAYALLNRARTRAPEAVRDWRVQLRPVRRGVRAFALLTMVPTAPAGGPPRLRWLLSTADAGNWAEHALRAERSFADSLLDAAEAAALVLDLNGRVVRANPYAIAASGMSRDELLGREWAGALLAPEGRPEARRAVVHAIQVGKGPRFTAALWGRRGDGPSLAWTSRALSLVGGAGPHVLVLGHDISDLQEAQRRALEAERLAAIGQVMASLAHEGRNLLHASQACLERLAWRLEGQGEPLELLRRAQRAQQGLALLFEDVRAYAAPLRLELGLCPLPEVWRAVFAEVRASSPERQAELVESITGDASCQVDAFRIRQVFRNLMENSFAACPGAVRVEITCAEEAREGTRGLRVRVRDNGPGLGPEQLQRLFEPFFTTKHGGTGLGMTIARRIVEAHRGNITVGGTGPGAEFILWLPRTPQ